MTYRTGRISEFMNWTKQVIREPGAAEGVPKRWFDSEETASKAVTGDLTAEALVKLLSPDNLRLLRLIGQSKPRSLRELAELTGRKASNLSRTLKKLESAGIVEMRPGPGRARIPALVARRVRLEVDLVGAAEHAELR
jgi:predicted transcriptional regulator